MPEDIKSSIPYIKRIIDGFNIPVISMEGYEADDILGTLAHQGEEEGMEVKCPPRALSIALETAEPACSPHTLG